MITFLHNRLIYYNVLHIPSPIKGAEIRTGQGSYFVRQTATEALDGIVIFDKSVLTRPLHHDLLSAFA